MEIKRGDILLYDKLGTGIYKYIEEAVVFGEKLESKSDAYFFHTAIALSDSEKIEADGKTIAKHPIIQSTQPKVFRLPNVTEFALGAMEAKLGQPYNLLEIADDALRMATHNLLHLPEFLMRPLYHHSAVCSRLVAEYLFYLGHMTDPYEPNISPQDIFEAVKQWQIKE
jgi:hypothetical protein